MNDFSKLWDTWWTQLAPYIPYIAVALLIIIILVVRGKMRKKEAEQEKAAKIKREIEEEEKKKQRAIERKQQEQQDKEFLCACREDLKNNLLQYINGFHLQIQNNTLVFQQNNPDEKLIVIKCFWNGISIGFGYQIDDDLFSWIVIIGNSICCQIDNKNIDNIHKAAMFFNLDLKDSGLDREINPFIGSNDYIKTENSQKLDKIIRDEKKRQKENDNPEVGNFVKNVVERMLLTIDKLFHNTSLISSCTKAAQSTANLANVIADQMNRWETPSETSFQFESSILFPGFELVGLPQKNTDWIDKFVIVINIYAKEATVLIGPVKFKNSKTKEELEKIVEEYTAKFGTFFKAMCNDTEIMLGIGIGNFTITSEKDPATIIAFYKTFIQHSEEIRNFFKEKD